MRIPLDYYRILGLPIQATPEQLQQAHRDRVLQLPRREYSELAIAARRALLDEAHTILSQPQTRQEYDSKFMRSEGIRPDSRLKDGGPPPGPHIDLAENQLVGALLLLQELGEYELVLQLGNPLLNRPSLPRGLGGEDEIIHADASLTVALAYLELGREYWHQGHYESAANALEAGQDLLMREGLFTTVRGEIKSDLYKLRPYRVLELVALPPDNVVERRKGIQILRDMLQERGGMDGGGDDQSGLSIDDFLRFVQQLRDYLTAEEQQSLFETEARRPSAVATYLCVYALLARGFAEHKPDLIRQAKSFLRRLGKRQDVHLEQAICALFLGQTEEASHALELSREYEAITFIRDHSQGSPDWLPGLCVYAEQWLREEVFPHFRDLTQCQATLKEYFADAQVQTYLESMPSEASALSNEWEQVSGFGRVNPSDRSLDRLGDRSPYNGHLTANNGTAPDATRLGVSPSSLASVSSGADSSPSTAQRGSSSRASGHRSPNPSEGHSGSRRSGNNTPTASPTPPAGKAAPSGQAAATAQRDRDSRSRHTHTAGGDSKGDNSRTSAPRDRNRRTATQSFKLGRLLLLGGTGLLLLWGLVFAVLNLVGGFGGEMGINRAANAGRDQLQVRLDEPLWSPPPAPEPDPNLPPTTLTTPEEAKRLVELWLQAKGKAMGKDYDVASLRTILTGEELRFRQRAAQSAKEEGYYAEYEHEVEVEEVQVNPEAPDRAVVIAKVTEVAQFYVNGTQDDASSYRESLRLQYNFLREENQWRIERMKLLSPGT
ncbi:MAG: IMS domain-containing protein [Prochlorothrix sp.]|nr:IMS domain-containing protein [Prochlorothrix sp.]